MFEVLLSSLKTDVNNNDLHSIGFDFPSSQDLLEELTHVKETLLQFDVETVVGHRNLSVDDIIYNAFDQTVLFTGETDFRII